MFSVLVDDWGLAMVGFNFGFHSWWLVLTILRTMEQGTNTIQELKMMFR